MLTSQSPKTPNSQSDAKLDAPFDPSLMYAVFDVENGLRGVNKFVVLRLCQLLWQKNDEIRKILGMCAEHLLFKNHSVFIESRPKNLPIVFLPEKPLENVFYQMKNTVDFRGVGCTVSIPFKLLYPKTCLLEVKIKKCIRVGVALKTLFPFLHTHEVYMVEGACTIFDIGYIAIGKSIRRVSSNCDFWNRDVDTCLTLELDSSSSSSPSPSHGSGLSSSSPSPLTRRDMPAWTHTHTYTLRLFVNGRQVPHCVTGVPEDVWFMLMCGNESEGGTAEVKSLRMVASSIKEKSVKCTEHSWENFEKTGNF